MRENTLPVARRNRHQGGRKECETTDGHHHISRQGIRHHRAKPQQQIHARLDHGGRMQQGARRRRRNHRAEQPSVERHLRTLRERGEGETCDRKHHKCLPRRGGFRGDLREICHVKLKCAVQNGDGKPESAEQIHPQCLERIGDGLRQLVVPDQQEGADARHFPEEKDPPEIVREQKAEHGSKENEQHGEKPRAALRIIRVVLMIIPDIPVRIAADQSSDDANHKAHHHRQIIDADIMHILCQRSRLGLSCDIQPHDRERAARRQQQDIIFFIPDAVIKDCSHQEQLAEHDKHIRDSRIGEEQILRPRMTARQNVIVGPGAGRKRNHCCDNDHTAADRYRGSCGRRLPHTEHQKRRGKWKEDQKYNELHKKPPVVSSDIGTLAQRSGRHCAVLHAKCITGNFITITR